VNYPAGFSCLGFGTQSKQEEQGNESHVWSRWI
jgi:hypothetical protein